MKVYVAVDIGCIECGEDSDVVGVYTSREDAQRALHVAREKQEADWTGQHDWIIVEKVVDADIVGEVIDGSIAPKKLEG